MPRKVTSSGRLKSNDKTSEKLAMGRKKSPRAKKPTAVADGGKWFGSGRKVAEHGEGPAIRQQAQIGRGRRTKTVTRGAAG